MGAGEQAQQLRAENLFPEPMLGSAQRPVTPVPRVSEGDLYSQTDTHIYTGLQKK